MDERDKTPEEIRALRDSLQEARGQFFSQLEALRPGLHRFCTRMTGSVLDGEDLVQETLAHAFFKLPSLRDEERFEAWLFRIAHNKCIDHLRRQRGDFWATEVVELADEDPREPLDAELATREEVLEALRLLVSTLPPMERACVVLKEVFEYSLKEIAEITGSTVGGVKAALHRGRGKLKRASAQPIDAPQEPEDPEELALLQAYLDRFSRRDWEGARELLRADARLDVVGVVQFQGIAAIEAQYFHRYSQLTVDWRFELCRVDGVLMPVQWRTQDDGQWRPHSAKGIAFKDGKIASIRDCVHVAYLLSGATVERLDGSASFCMA